MGEDLDQRSQHTPKYDNSQLLKGSNPSRSRYKTVTSGVNCRRINSLTECQDAATELHDQLGLSNNPTADFEIEAGSPPNCYVWVANGGHGGGYENELYFNEDFNSVMECSELSPCICINLR